jgi:hypothetical protein
MYSTTRPSRPSGKSFTTLETAGIKSFGEEIFDSGIRVREEIQARSLPSAVLRLYADSHSEPGSEEMAEQAAGSPALALSVTDSTRTVIQSQAVKKWQNRLLEARHLHFQ